jgi:hypothetical protein
MKEEGASIILGSWKLRHLLAGPGLLELARCCKIIIPLDSQHLFALIISSYKWKPTFRVGVTAARGAFVDIHVMIKREE